MAQTDPAPALNMGAEEEMKKTPYITVISR
jgi:hypothetical protein